MRRFFPPAFFHPTQLVQTAFLALVLLGGPVKQTDAQSLTAPPSPAVVSSPDDPGVPADGSALPPKATLEPTTMAASFDFSQGVILLDVDLGGGFKAKMAFDTGDEANVLDIGLAREMKVPFDQMLHVPKGRGPDLSVQQLQINPVHVGDADFPARDFLILPVADELKGDGITARGTLGYRFFEEKVVQIDYPARTLRMLAAMPPKPEGAIVLPIHWMPYDQKGLGVTTVNELKLGEHALTAQYDTLFFGSVILFTSKLPWLETTRLPGLASANYEGGLLRAALPAEPLALGEHRLAAPLPVYLADKDARVPETEISAVLGNVFFQNAVVTLDYKHDQMLVEWKR